MADEISNPPGTIKFAGQVLEISSVDVVQAAVADVIIEARDTGAGGIQVSFGTIRLTGHPARVDVLVSARLRFEYGLAMDLRNTLDNLLRPSVPKSETH